MKARRKKNLYLGFGPSRPLSKKELAQGRREHKARVKAKRSALKKERQSEARTLFRQLQKDSKPQRAKRFKMPPQDEAAWQELLRSNPRAAKQFLREHAMSKKRKKKNPKRRSRKGKMPAGLKAYWAKKRRAKAKRKNPRKRPRASKPKIRRRKRAVPRVKNYRRTRKPRTRRRRTRNASPRSGVIKIQAPKGLGPKGLAAFRREISKAYGAPTRIVSA